jgi:hypothetical protein
MQGGEKKIQPISKIDASFFYWMEEEGGRDAVAVAWVGSGLWERRMAFRLSSALTRTTS